MWGWVGEIEGCQGGGWRWEGSEQRKVGEGGGGERGGVKREVTFQMGTGRGAQAEGGCAGKMGRRGRLR